MLAALTVRDIVLIETALLEFAPGLNVLTGETGAGKSILLDALGLAAGARGGGRAGIRQGASQGSATAVFEPSSNNPALALLNEQAIAVDQEIVLRRTIGPDGRTRAFINDEAVGVALLQDVGHSLLEVHGLADDRGLFDVSTHRGLLDAFAGHGVLLRETADAFAAFAGARKAFADVKAQSTKTQADADYLQEAAKDLAGLAPKAGEEARLTAKRALLMNATKIAQNVSDAAELLVGERGAISAISGALRRLSRAGDEARRSTHAAEEALDQAFVAVEEARRELEALQSRLDVEPGELERVEDRIHDLRSAARKYGVPCDSLENLEADFRFRRDQLGSGADALKRAEEQLSETRSGFLKLAERLSDARKIAAHQLEVAVANELVPLKLAHARFRVRLEALDEKSATSNGMQRVIFEVATLDGASFGPLSKIASGGELARFSLALKVALAEASPPAAMIFDEVDRGVGGAVADAVGERLQRLSLTTQVLLVTHSPQVAARAHRHFRITRSADKTKVALLNETDRVEEVARMLSGAAITQEARAAARRLLQAARPPATRRRKRA